MNRRYVNAYYCRGKTYDGKGRADKAIADFNRAIQLRYSDPIIFCSRGIARKKAKQYKKALYDFEKAASHGVWDGMLEAGMMYLQRSAVPQDYVKAYMWLTIAKKSGDRLGKKAAEVALSALHGKGISLAQIEEAEKLADAWQERHEKR